MSDGFGFARKLLFRAQALRISFERNCSSSSIKCWSLTNPPSAPIEYASGTSTRFPRMSTYGRASSLVGGLEEAVDRGVCGGAFNDFPSKGKSSESEAQEAGDCPTVGSEEEAAILPLGCERGSSSSKRRGEVDGGKGSESEAVVGANSLGFQQRTSPCHSFSGMLPGTRRERSALMMRSASLMNPVGKGVRITSTSSRLL